MAALDRRRDHLDLLAAEDAAVAGVRIEPRDPDPRARLAGGAQRALGEADRLQHAVPGDQLGHGAQRHMRGHARGRELIGRIHFTDMTLKIKHLDEKSELVLELQPALVHGLLVAGREADAIELAGLREAERQAEGVEHRLAGDAG